MPFASELDAAKAAVEIVRSGFTAGSIKLNGCANMNAGEAERQASADAAYLKTLLAGLEAALHKK